MKVTTEGKINKKGLLKKQFPPSFTQFKEGDQPINEEKSLEWMDAQIKMKEFDISNYDRPKMAKIGYYWSEQHTIEIVNLLKQYQDVFSHN